MSKSKSKSKSKSRGQGKTALRGVAPKISGWYLIAAGVAYTTAGPAIFSDTVPLKSTPYRKTRMPSGTDTDMNTATAELAAHGYGCRYG